MDQFYDTIQQLGNLVMKYISFILFFLLLWLAGCKKQRINSEEKVVFSICPVDTSYISEASPLGNINPPGHTFPSNHIGFYLRGDKNVPVQAMTKGIIRMVYYNEWSDDYRIEFSYNESVISYFDHICCLSVNVAEGFTIQAGDTIGYARPQLGAFDIGVVNYNKSNSFIVPERYHEFSLYYDDPYSYFTDSIRQILELKNSRISEPKGGKADFDKEGTLAGNWFLEGTPYTYEASSFTYGMNQLAFVYDMYNASTIRISCGGTLETAPFNRKVIGNLPDPERVTNLSGVVKYQLESAGYNSTLMVQIIDDRKIRAEVFSDTLPGELNDFTELSRIYVR
jgi:hypothetical protein